MNLVNQVGAFCASMSCYPYSSAFLFHSQSPTLCMPVSLTSVSAELIWEHLVQISDPAVLVISDTRWYSLHLYRIHHLPPNRLHCHPDLPWGDSWEAIVGYPNCILVHCSLHVGPDESSFFWFGGYSILEFVLQRWLLQTKLLAKMIVLTISMQLHNHDASVTRMTWRSL